MYDLWFSLPNVSNSDSNVFLTVTKAFVVGSKLWDAVIFRQTDVYLRNAAHQVNSWFFLLSRNWMRFMIAQLLKEFIKCFALRRLFVSTWNSTKNILQSMTRKFFPSDLLWRFLRPSNRLKIVLRNITKQMIRRPWPGLRPNKKIITRNILGTRQGIERRAKSQSIFLKFCCTDQTSDWETRHIRKTIPYNLHFKQASKTVSQNAQWRHKSEEGTRFFNFQWLGGWWLKLRFCIFLNGLGFYT